MRQDCLEILISGYTFRFRPNTMVGGGVVMFYISKYGCIHIQKVYKIPKIVDMKQVPYSGLKSIRRHRKNFVGRVKWRTCVGAYV